MIVVAKFHQLSNSDLYQICKLREEVFILEQKITCEAELDGQDMVATHYYIKKDNQVVCYARVLNGDQMIKLGRLCTKQSYRNQGLAAQIVNHIKNEFDSINISAQEHAVPFYKSLGFLPVGKRYKEADIWHQKMVYIK